jgi:hypothetical protein
MGMLDFVDGELEAAEEEEEVGSMDSSLDPLLLFICCDSAT